MSWCRLCKCSEETMTIFWYIKRSEETVGHPLIHSSVEFELWSYVFRSFGIQLVLPAKVFDLLCQWQNGWANYSSDIYNLVFLLLLWTMWREGIDVLLKMWNARGLNCLQSSTVPYMSGLMLQFLQIVILLNHSKSHCIWK